MHTVINYLNGKYNCKHGHIEFNADKYFLIKSKCSKKINYVLFYYSKNKRGKKNNVSRQDYFHYYNKNDILIQHYSNGNLS